MLALDEHESLLGLRAMATVARADNALTDTESDILTVAAEALGRPGLDVRALTPVTPAELSLGLTNPVARERAVQAMILTAMIDGHVDGPEADTVTRFAEALGVNEARVRNLRQLAEGRTRLLWFDLARRSFARPIFEDALRKRGLRGVWDIVGPMVGLARDPDREREYLALGELPEESLGYAYYRFIVDNELGFPGEGAVAEEGVWHDVSHVLGGYGIDTAGEVSVVSFIAGYKREDPFFWLFTIALQFHLGVRVSPYSPRERGYFDPRRVRRALERGAAMNTDISRDWSLWEHCHRPLAAVRRELGVPPP